MTASQPILWLVHGWGFGPGLWHPLLKRLPGWPARRVNLGFFGAASLLEPPEQPFIAMGHSLGFLWLLHRLAGHKGSCQGLVGINAFGRFSRSPDLPQGIHPRLVLRMKEQLALDPASVLLAFRQRSGLDSQYPGEPMVDQGRLAWGLDLLLTLDGRGLLSDMSLPVLFLASRDDAIVPPALTRATLPRQQTRWCDTGGHLLPLSQPGWCGQALQTWLPQP